MFQVGNTVQFAYDGELRHVRIEKVKMGYPFLGVIGPVPALITGWDATANYPTGGYRSFTVAKIETPVLVNPR